MTKEEAKQLSEEMIDAAANLVCKDDPGDEARIIELMEWAEFYRWLSTTDNPQEYDD